jgi:ADP-ribose pyrophosphatase
MKALERKEIAFSGKLLRLYRSWIKLPDGREGYFEKIEHPGAALVVPYFKGKVALIRQYRPVLGQYILELPAGTLNKGEKPGKCARREVEEETGLVVSELKRIGRICTTPGFCNEMIHVYMAECSRMSGVKMDEDEFITTKLYSLARIRKLFKDGHIIDSKTIAALALAGII